MQENEFYLGLNVNNGARLSGIEYMEEQKCPSGKGGSSPPELIK